MTSYAKSKYKNPWPNGVPNSSASSRGWGAGWPHCQANKMVTIVAQDQTKGEDYDIKVTVRKEIAAMVADLLEATDKLYDIDQHDTGAYNCRAIAGTNTASNHSWGLAVDINWDDNPQGPFHSEIPPAVVAMWIDCGFGWGGFYGHALPDTMHFEYLGTPSSVKADAVKAAKYNGKAAPKPVEPTPAPAVKLVKLAAGVVPGKRDAQVKVLQQLLIKAGYGPISGSPSTYYGENTENAVARFHKKNPKFASNSQYDGAIGAGGFAELQKEAAK